jgi:hypothetical protein
MGVVKIGDPGWYSDRLQFMLILLFLLLLFSRCDQGGQ